MVVVVVVVRRVRTGDSREEKEDSDRRESVRRVSSCSDRRTEAGGLELKHN